MTLTSGSRASVKESTGWAASQREGEGGKCVWASWDYWAEEQSGPRGEKKGERKVLASGPERGGKGFVFFLFLFSFLLFQSHFQNRFKNHFELFLNFSKTTQHNK